ncbi:glycoside hydrolase family 26 protein [Mucilaginibacter sp.]|uniref:glycoside hydrolase family 26 protein n=1 Tax=Mucilaginibacter sp. TaxID=1882438 RepID=UPI0035BBE84E
MNITYCRIIIVGLLFFCSASATAQLYDPCDKLATRETRELYYSMQRLVDAGTMFGHHDDTAYGIGWCFEPGNSDVKTITGNYPAVYGWDLARIEHDSTRDINNIPFEYQKKLIRQAYDRGGVNTFCWHMDNPANGKTAWDTTSRSIAMLLPGGAYHNTYVKYLDRAAAYMGSINGTTGEAVPILFRPFHELTGSWFWWGAKFSTADEFKALWQFTITYLRNDKKLHNLLIVYSVADFDSEADFMARYPGSDYVDFIGFDNYCYKNVAKYQMNLDKRLSLLDAIAIKNHKLACLPETGYETIPQADWWTSVLLPAIGSHKLSYVMAWRNAHMDHFYTPYTGQKSEADFRLFAHDPKMMFQNRVTRLGLYGKYVIATVNK